MEHKVYERNDVRVVIPIPHSYKDIAILIKSDYFRYRGEMLPIYKIFLKTLIMGGQHHFFSGSECPNIGKAGFIISPSIN